MLKPILISVGILGAIAAFAPRVPTPIAPQPQPPSPPAPPPTTGQGGLAVPGMPPPPAVPMTEELPIERDIRIDPDTAITRLRARVGNTIQMHAVSRRSADNPEGYYFTPSFAPPGTLFDLPTGSGDQPLLREEGANQFRMIAPGTFAIRWAPNYVVTVEVLP